MKPFQSFNSSDMILFLQLVEPTTMDPHASCKHLKCQMIILYFVFKNMFFLFDSCPGLEHFGVYYDNAIYYLSTNPDTDVVKHFLDEGKQIREIKGCKIPNHHLRPQYTFHLQG